MKKHWRTIELFGRGMLLMAIGFQLVTLSNFQAAKSEGDLSYLMENQYFIASMVRALAGSASDQKKAAQALEAFKNIEVYSERRESPFYTQIGSLNYIFVVLFLIGSFLVLYARYLELNSRSL